MTGYLRVVLACITLVITCCLPPNVMARFNPSVQPPFFETVQARLPAAEPTASTKGAVTEATMERLAWEIEQSKKLHMPMVIEFVSSDSNQCAQYNTSGAAECVAQLTEFETAAAHYAGRVKFIRCDVQNAAEILNGPDVRVLPTHVFISEYADSNHYTASKVWGLLSAQQLQDVILDKFNILP